MQRRKFGGPIGGRRGTGIFFMVWGRWKSGRRTTKNPIASKEVGGKAFVQVNRKAKWITRIEESQFEGQLRRGLREKSCL